MANYKNWGLIKIARIDNCLVKWWKMPECNKALDDDERFRIVSMGYGFTHSNISEFIQPYLDTQLGSAIFTLLSKKPSLLKKTYSNQLHKIIDNFNAIDDDAKDAIAEKLASIIKNKLHCEDNNYTPPISVTYNNDSFIVRLQQLTEEDLDLIYTWFPYDLREILKEVNTSIIYAPTHLIECKHCKIDKHDNLALCDVHEEHKDIDLLIIK